MSRRIAHGNVARTRKWGIPVGWRASGPDRTPVTEATEPPATPPPVDSTPETRPAAGGERLANDTERDALREPDRPPLVFGKPWDATASPERIWPAPLPEEHLTFVPHCDGRHGPMEGDAGGCVWCDVLADLASDMRETRRRVTALEAEAAALRAALGERRSRS